MNLWLARAEGLTAHLLWRLSYGRVAGHWLQRGKVTTTNTGLPEEEDGMAGINMPDATPSFASRIAELQREADLPPARNGHASDRRELSTGMFILLSLLVLALAVGSFFL